MRDEASRPPNERRFPASIPPEINHAVLTARLGADPQAARSPLGEPVTLLRVEFPVADPGDPQVLWTWASCMVEVPEGRASLDLDELRGGAPVLVAGQVSDRWVIEGGHTCRCAVIVATLVKSGAAALPAPPHPGCGPAASPGERP